MEKAYMIVVRRNSSGEFSYYRTGKGLTPFCTTNLSVAKGMITKLRKRSSHIGEYGILTVDPMTGTAFIDCNDFKV